MAKVERGDRVPMLDERPQLDEFEAVYFQAFAALTTCRSPAAQGVGPIKWTAVMNWCDERGEFDPDARAEMWTHISAMDALYVAHVQKMIKESIAESERKR